MSLAIPILENLWLGKSFLITIDEAMTNMFSFNSGELPQWSYDVMYSPWLPPSLAVEMSGVRNPMLYQYVNHKMLCALTYFMRNPKNWSVEFNTPPV
eukprot:5187438-Amphidinium_carterae.1